MVDIDTRELVGAWLATATAQAPVVTKAYDLEVPIGKATHKRIAYANPWSTARTFRLSSSNEQLMAVRYSALEVSCDSS
jgi:nephrocystin-4